jgi:hypothetical protein
MAEHEDWTAADDAVVRRAMATLRADVEATPLADVRFVKARGKARRRQRLLTWGAAAAAAVVVAGVAGYAALGTDRTPAPLPPQSSSTSGPAPTTAAPQFAALPTLADWRTDLGIEAKALTQVATPPTVLCGVLLPSGFVEGYSVGSDPSHPSGFALHFRPTGTTGAQAATALAEAVEKCRTPYTVLPHYRYPYGAAWVTNTIGSGYVGIASTKQAVTVLLYTDPTLKGDPLKAGFGDLLNTAQARLEAAGAPGPSSLDTEGVLPIAGAWEDALALPRGSVAVTQGGALDGGVECGDALGRPTHQQSWTQANSPVSGGAAYWDTGGDKARTDTLRQGVATCHAGPGFTVKSEYVGAYSIYSYSTPEAGSGWFAVVAGGRGVALLQLVDPAFNDIASGGFTEDELKALASTEGARLDRYASDTASTTSSPTVIGPKAVDQQMPVTGPDPKPSSKLFVAASQWTSKGLTGGAKAYAGPGSLEGSTAIASCETDQQQAGIGGSVGVVSVRAGSGSANYIGEQRVQADQSSEPVVQKGYVEARLSAAQALYAKGCRFANGTVKSTPGPSEGTYRLDTVFTDGSPTLSQWVGVTAQTTPGAVSTIVITKAANPKQGFAELDRLLNLARQK